MLDGVKIDRECTIQTCLAAKRMKRREAELVAEMSKRDKHGSKISSLDASISKLEGDIASHAQQDVAKKARLCSRMETAPAGMTFSPTRQSANPAYRSTTRSQSESIPAFRLMRRDDIMLEQVSEVPRLGGKLMNAPAVAPGGRKTIAGEDIDEDYVPSVEEVNDQPWTTRSTHPGLIRDPYMRKYKLHRYNTYLQSDKMKKLVVSATTGAKLVNKDGCDFNYTLYSKSQ
jgi:hypothetical protein